MAGNTTHKVKEAIPDEVHDDFATLKEDFGRLREDVQVLMKDTAALGRHGGQHVADSARRQGEQIAGKAREGVTKVETSITEHPMAALGIAVGVGLLAGMILRR